MSLRCPNCGSYRLSWLHVRVDGGPDRRYRRNPQLCPDCGWRSDRLSMKVILGCLSLGLVGCLFLSCIGLMLPKSKTSQPATTRQTVRTSTR